MTVTVKHSKTNAISDWTQAQLDEQIALGNFAEGTVLADIVLPSDWNNDHTLTGVGTMAEQNANSVAITGGSINGTTIGATTASTGRFTSVTTPSVTATTNDLTLSAISTGAVKFSTAGGLQMQIADKASAVDYLQITGGAATQAAVFFTTQGTDTNIGYDMRGKGAGTYWFSTGSAFAPQMTITNTTSAVNYVQVTGAATGNRPAITAQGSDANAGLSLFAKGTGGVFIGSNLGTTAAIVSTPTTGTNYFAVNGSATTIAPTISVAGGDTNISMAFQPKGTGAIDLAAGSSGVNISNGGTVTAITRTVAGTNYTSPPSVLISAPTTAGGVQATASTFLQLATTPTITSGGTGYTVNDVLTFVGGTIGLGANAAQVTVTSVSGGVITGISITTFGTGYSVVPTSPISVTGGTGTGATFTVTGWQISGFTITNAGSGYIEQPTVTFSGGGGSGAAAYATVGSGTILRSLGNTMDLYAPSGIGFRIGDGGATTAGYWTAFPNTASPSLRAIGSSSGQIATGSAVPIQFLTNATSSSVEQLRVAHTASAVNYVQVTGGATSIQPVISAQGSDANIGLRLYSKGTFGVSAWTNGGASRQFQVEHTAGTIVNYATATGSAAGSAPVFSVAGTDTNIDLSLTTKGTGAVRLNTGNGEAFRASQAFLTGTAVNYFDASGRQTGLGPILSVNGSDADVRMNITAKGTGSIGFYTNLANTLQMQVTPTASAVNYVQVTGSATGANPIISVQGSDATRGMQFATKGTGALLFYSNGGSNLQFRIDGGASSVNYLDMYGNVAGSSPSVRVAGTDTNIDLTLTPKGTGNVRFGTHTATADVAISGYIEIKDSGGTIRKLAVIT